MYAKDQDLIVHKFDIKDKVFTLDVSLFILNFALDSLLWASFSELFDQQILFIIIYEVLTVFNAKVTESKIIQTLIILQFFAEVIELSLLIEIMSVIANLFVAKEQDSIMSLFIAMLILSSMLNLIIKDFIDKTINWRWIKEVMMIFMSILWLIDMLVISKTYALVLQHHHAQKVSKMTSKVYKNHDDVDHDQLIFCQLFQTSLLCSWMLLFCKLIVLLLSIYMMIIYETLYMLLNIFSIVYQ